MVVVDGFERMMTSRQRSKEDLARRLQAESVQRRVFRAAWIQEVQTMNQRRPAVVTEATVLLRGEVGLFLRVLVLPLRGVVERGKMAGPCGCGLRIQVLRSKTDRNYNRSTGRFRHSHNTLGRSLQQS